MDILNETAIAISDAPRHIAGRPHIATVWRWRTHGIGGTRLESFTVGGRVFTSKEAITRFIERTTAARNGQPADAKPSRKRQAAIERAERELDKAGI